MISAKGGAVLLWNRTDTIMIKQLVVESRREARREVTQKKGLRLRRSWGGSFDLSPSLSFPWT